MGFELMHNFDRPYHAESISDFWRRWHISLSSWFRDYLYIPLGGNRKGFPRHLANLMIVFLASGLWHGANWTFVVWGGLHGIYLVTSVLTTGLRERLARLTRLDRVPALRRALRVAVTFHLVLFAWIFFRANTLADALTVLRRMVSGINLDMSLLIVPQFDKLEFVFAGIAILILEAVQIAQGREGFGDWLAKRPAPVRWACYYLIVVVIVLFGSFEQREFIYFQF